ncbi:MAG: pentapeptide repeat-containing protein, partial [Pseudomonadota bacterium]
QGADLVGAGLQEANLREARLQGATLREARLQGATLFKARLQGADLREARLQGAMLVGADFGAATESPKPSDGAAPVEGLGPKGLTQATLQRSFGDQTAWDSLPQEARVDAETGQPLTKPEHWADYRDADGRIDWLKAREAWEAWRKTLDPAEE